MRLFTGVGLDRNTNQALAQLTPADAAAWRKTSWIAPNKLHITLRFIGEVTPEVGQQVQSTLRQVAFAPFQVRIRGVGTFGGRRAPRVLWVGADACPEIIELFRNVSYCIDIADKDNSIHRFVPHITLARIRGTRPRQLVDFLARNVDFALPPVNVTRFTLFRSRLGQGGTPYNVIEHYPARQPC